MNVWAVAGLVFVAMSAMSWGAYHIGRRVEAKSWMDAGWFISPLGGEPKGPGARNG